MWPAVGWLERFVRAKHPLEVCEALAGKLGVSCCSLRDHHRDARSFLHWHTIRLDWQEPWQVCPPCPSLRSLSSHENLPLQCPSLAHSPPSSVCVCVCVCGVKWETWRILETWDMLLLLFLPYIFDLLFEEWHTKGVCSMRHGQQKCCLLHTSRPSSAVSG